MNRKLFLIFLLLFALILKCSALEITTTAKEVNGVYYVVKGQPVDITIKGNPGQVLYVTMTYNFELGVQNGKYDYKTTLNLPIDAKRLKIYASKVQNLNIRAYLFIIPVKTITANANAEGTAVIALGNIKAGSYSVEIFGDSTQNTVTISVVVESYITLNSNGVYEIDYSTASLPPGNLIVNIGGETLQARVVASADQIPTTTTTLPTTTETTVTTVTTQTTLPTTTIMMPTTVTTIPTITTITTPTMSMPTTTVPTTATTRTTMKTTVTTSTTKPTTMPTTTKTVHTTVRTTIQTTTTVTKTENKKTNGNSTNLGNVKVPGFSVDLFFAALAIAYVLRRAR